ncbi:sodium hydrogen exchanger 4 [Actinidia rufa]|uniref:Sodium hydrogen exchanger 4 n=1 Tax=Actinidia rufa TaxID=165716 RepID=A0A7J0EFF5_9ERIC|nr:sodium hydrogen exchanger 4 [Actinidia rufa]
MKNCSSYTPSTYNIQRQISVQEEMVKKKRNATWIGKGSSEVAKMEGIDGGSLMGPSLAMVVVMVMVGSTTRVSHSSALFQSLLFEAYGRTVNPRSFGPKPFADDRKPAMAVTTWKFIIKSADMGEDVQKEGRRRGNRRIPFSLFRDFVYFLISIAR